jgi:hypothetical protein
MSHAASQSPRSAGETPSDRSLRGESRRCDGKATTLRSFRADLAVLPGFDAFVTSLRRWGPCRSLLSLASDLEKSSEWERVCGVCTGAWHSEVAHIQLQAGIGHLFVECMQDDHKKIAMRGAWADAIFL